MAPSHHQQGFTLVEVLVAITILLVGVLGVVSLVDGANAVTSKTKAREGGTNVARSVIEVSRSIRYRDLTTASLLEALGHRPGLADSESGATGYTIHQRGVEYTMTLGVCSLDDPKDNLGDHANGLLFCDDTDALGTGQPAVDRNPDDYKRVRVSLDWSSRGTEQSVTQTSAIINPVGGLGPSVTRLDMTMPSSSSDPYVIDSSAVTTAHFAASTSTSAATLTWSVSGDEQGDANGAGTSFDFDWMLARTDGTVVYNDCTYVIQAEALDEQGRAGAPRARTVIVNRLPAYAPTELAGGHNGNGGRVDLQWSANPECDVLGYRVYRGTTAGSDGDLVQCLGEPNPQYTTQTQCLDADAPAGTLYYTVVGIDRQTSGALREGTRSQLLVDGAPNAVPTAPTQLSMCIGGSSGCDDPAGNPAPDGVIAIRWDASSDADGEVQLYRVYRDGTTYGDRVGTFFPKGGGLVWFESHPDSASHEYRLSAVDDDFGESPLSDAITAP